MCELIQNIKHMESFSYIVKGHLGEQSVHQLVHAPGSRLQGSLLHQHLSCFLQPALQHITHHLQNPDTKYVILEISHSTLCQTK